MAFELFRRLVSFAAKLRRKHSGSRAEQTNRRRKVFFEGLEDRRVMATLTESGTTLTVSLDNTGEFIQISSAGASYLFSSSSPILDGGITPGRATFGGTSATVTGDGLTAYDTIRIVDAAGIQDAKVIFADSGANVYSDHFLVALNQDTFVASNEQSVVFNGTSNFGDFNVNVSTTRNVVVSGSAKVLTLSGSVAFNANPAGTTSGAYSGIVVSPSSRIETGAAGTIGLYGKAGTSSFVPNAVLNGVLIQGGAVVKGGSAGDAVVIAGVGGIDFGSQAANGVTIASFGTLVTSTGGNVKITGQGGSASNARGVEITAEVSAGGAGNLIVTGTAGASGGTVGGVELSSNALLVTSGGNIEVTGAGGTTGGLAGIWMLGNSQIKAGGNGNVTVTGTGGTGAGNVSYGIRMSGSGPGVSSTIITSSGGNVRVTGTGGGGTGSSTFNAGVGMLTFATISAGGTGSVEVIGTGGNSTGNGNHGVLLNDGNCTISSSGGNVQVTGTAGNGGTRSGISAVPGVISTPVAGGNITLIADSMALGGLGTVNAGTRTVAIRPKTTNASVGMNLGGADAVGVLGLTNEELSRVTAGTLELGGTGAGTVTISSSITRSASTNVKLTSSGDIVFNPGSISTAGGNLTLSPGAAGSIQPITSGSEVSIAAATLNFGSGADLSIRIDGTVPDTGYRQLNVNGAINLSGADLVLSGTHVPVLGQTFVIVANDGSESINGTFNGLAEGAVLGHFLGSDLAAMISYQGGTNSNDVVLTVIADAPAAITLTSTSVPQNPAVGTVVGTLSTTDPNPNTTHTYALVSGTGDEGNAAFQVVGNTLRTTASFNYSQSSYSVRVRTTNEAGLSLEKQLTVNILPDFWALRAGSSSLDYGSAVAADRAGNSYVTGVFKGTVDFDPSASVVSLISAQNGSMFIAKYDPAGRLVWAKIAGNPSNAFSTIEPRGIAIDNGGNVYTTGTFQGTEDFDPSAATFSLAASDGASAFVSKLDANGNLAWAKKLGGGSHGNGIALDTLGNVYTVGDFTGGDFDPGAGTFNMSGGSAGDVFVSKLDNTGGFVWAKQFVGSGAVDIGNDIAVDSSGNVYTTGRFFAANTDFDPGPGVFPLTPTGNYDGFISKLDATGAFVWAKKWGGAVTDEGNDLAVDSLGNVYLYGTGTFNLAPTTITGQFLAKFDGSGNYVWAHQPGGSAATDLVSDGLGGIYLVGSFAGTVDFDPGAASFLLSSSGAADGFLTKVTSGGQFLWTKKFGGSGDEFTMGVAVDGAGYVAMTGYFTSTNADFNPDSGVLPLTAEPNGDIFVSKLLNVLGSDGVPDSVEDAAPGGGDGNGDGTPDSQQENVTSLPSAAPGAAYVTLASPGGTTLENVQAVSTPPPGLPVGAQTPLGLLQFSVSALAPSATTTVILYVPAGTLVNQYWKYGSTGWYNFAWDGTTGATFEDKNGDGTLDVVLHFVDGLRGDDDGAANGVVVDPGALVFVAPPPQPKLESIVYFNSDATAERTFTSNSTGQRSIIKKIQIVLDREIQLTPQQLSAGIQVSAVPSGTSVTFTGTATASGGKTTIVLALTGSLTDAAGLKDGNYRLTINGTALGIDADNNGTDGGSRVDDFFRFFGDSDGDRDVDAVDYNRFRSANANTAPNDVLDLLFNFNNDSNTDLTTDLTEFRARYTKKLAPPVSNT